MWIPFPQTLALMRDPVGCVIDVSLCVVFVREVALGYSRVVLARIWRHENALFAPICRRFLKKAVHHGAESLASVCCCSSGCCSSCSSLCIFAKRTVLGVTTVWFRMPRGVEEAEEAEGFEKAKLASLGDLSCCVRD